MDVRSALLFPHTCIRPAHLERALRHFRPLSLCLPWHTESSFSRPDSPYAPSVRICRPPLALKPPDDFGALLSGYMGWAEDHRGGGYAAFIKTLQDGLTGEETSWEIGKMIRTGGPPALDDCKEKALQWHLVLRLAHQTEENRGEAEDLLRRVKGMRSPLEEALGGEPAGPDLLADLPPFRSDPPIPAQRLDRILEAFAGLFREPLQTHEVLLTLDPRVLAHLKERFGDSVKDIAPEAPEAAAPDDRVTALRPAGQDKAAQGRRDPVLTALSGKTIVLLETGP
jgi:hypothetical protein